MRPWSRAGGAHEVGRRSRRAGPRRARRSTTVAPARELVALASRRVRGRRSTSRRSRRRSREVDAGVDPDDVAALRARPAASASGTSASPSTDSRHDLEHRVDGVGGRAELGDRVEERARRGSVAVHARRRERPDRPIACSLMACAARDATQLVVGLQELGRCRAPRSRRTLRAVAERGPERERRVVERDAPRRQRLPRARARRRRSRPGSIPRATDRCGAPSGNAVKARRGRRRPAAPRPTATPTRARRRRREPARRSGRRRCSARSTRATSTPAAAIAVRTFPTRSRPMPVEVDVRSSAHVEPVTSTTASASERGPGSTSSTVV